MIILITGGTGSFGQACIKRLLKDTDIRRIIVLSRDELKQWEMQNRISDKRIRYFLGDIRDRDRLLRAFIGVDCIIHAAALKQVPALEYNPTEAIKTNILGTQNVIEAAIDTRVSKVLMLSTDKAVNPINLYGATKLCAERLMLASGIYSSGRKTRFSVVRYGNVCNSRGSVMQVFESQKNEGILKVTDERMTRFWITLEDSVDFVLKCLSLMHGGEIFVPKLPSRRIVDVAREIAPACEIAYTGIRAGEKIHETLISKGEFGTVEEYEDYFVIRQDVTGTMNHKAYTSS